MTISDEQACPRRNDMDTVERRVGIAAQYLLRELSTFLDGDALRRRISESYLGAYDLTRGELALATVHAINMLAVGVFAGTA
jgi:hypothetical protein